jgi:hypothetical protein
MVVLAALLAVSPAGPVSGQGLGSVAKETEAKRKTVKASGKVYTNDDLKGSPTPAASAPAATPGAQAAEPSPSGGDKAKPEPAKDEAAWRDRVKVERDALAKAESFASALQSQINGLYGEFTACQAPTQCNDVSAKRQKAISDLDGAKKEIETHKKALADIQEEARKAGVPAGWVR